MRLMPATGLLLIVLAGCRADRAQHSTQPMSERARDSAIGASKLPGAQGVNGALRAVDSGAARRAREDSIASEP